MAFSSALVWEVRTTGNSANGGAFRATAIAGTPSAPTVTGASTGGTVAAGTYYVVLTYSPGGENRESPKSPETSVVLTGTTSKFTVTHPSDPGNGNGTTYNVYAGTTSGGPYFPQGTALAIGSDRVVTTTPPTTGIQPPGVDYSQQDSPQVTYTDLVIGGTNTTATSAGNPFTPAHVGNVVNVTSGTGFTVQRVEITGVTAAGVATFDKSLGTTTSTGGNGKLGGAVDHISTIVTVVVGSNMVYVKSGTYTITVALAIPAAGGGATGSRATTYIGYGSTRDDGGTRPIVTTATTGINLWEITGGPGHIRFEHLSFTHTGSPRGYGFVPKNTELCIEIDDCVFDGLLYAVQGDFIVQFVFTNLLVSRCEIKNCVTNAIVNGGVTTLVGNYIHDNGGAGWKPGNYSGPNENILTATGNIFARNLKGLHDDMGARRYVLTGNVFQGHTNDGIHINTSQPTLTNLWLDRNVFAGNGGYGVKVDAARTASQLGGQLNAYGNNASGARLNLLASPGDVTLTGDPFTNASVGDFSTNLTAGAGLAIRGLTLAYPGGTTTSYPDSGAAQHSDASVPVGTVGRSLVVQNIGTY